jgi:hypothetical protein
VRGEAYLLGGRGQEASSEFQEVLSHGGLTGNEPIGALARLNLTRAWSLQHDAVKYRDAYLDFLDLWKEADAQIPVLKAAKEESSRDQRELV